MPWQEFVQTRRWMIGDAGKHVGEPGTGIDVVEFGGDDQRIHGRRPLAASVGTREQPWLAPECNSSQRPFSALFVIQILPSSTKRLNVGQRLSI